MTYKSYDAPECTKVGRQWWDRRFYGMKYIVEYTIPGERGKIHKASFESEEARKKKIDAIKKKGGNIKATSRG